MDSILKVVDLNVSVSSQGIEKTILSEVNFELNKGDLLALIGPSGAGKTFIMRSLLRLYEGIDGIKVSGEVVYSFDENIDVLSCSDEKLNWLRKHKIGLVFQNSTQVLNPSIKVFKQLKEGISEIEFESKIEEICSTVGLKKEDIINKYPHEFSGGQFQRLLIAMALVKEPDILLIDEPTSSLNERLKIEILEVIKKLNKEKGITILLISHDLDLVASYFEKGLFVNNGIVDYSRDLNKIKKEPFFIDDFTNMANLNVTSLDREPLLELKNISKSYSNVGEKKVVLNQFNLEIAKSEIVGLIGDSGSGKSTVAKIIKGLTPIDKGSVYWEEKDMSTMSLAFKKEFIKNVQIIFQDPLSVLSPHLTGYEVLEEMMTIHSVTMPRKELNEFLKSFKLSIDTVARIPSKLSGGQRQRLLIARAFICSPKLLICDEILSSIDLQTKNEIIGLLVDKAIEKNMSILFISHDMKTIQKIQNLVDMRVINLSS